MLSKDEFFNDLCMNHSSSDVLEAPINHRRRHHHLHPTWKTKNTHWNRLSDIYNESVFVSVEARSEGEESAVSEHHHVPINLPLLQFTGSSLSCCCNNSYFHLHDCINYSITHVSRLQKCFPHREPCIRALTKAGNRTYTRLALH